MNTSSLEVANCDGLNKGGMRHETSNEDYAEQRTGSAGSAAKGCPRFAMNPSSKKNRSGYW